MLVNYEGYNLVVDPNGDFIMLYKCYENGCNCLNCTERIMDGCIIDELDTELLDI